MAKTNFESLRVYQLAERLADQIWSIVVKWNVFARDTVGKQLVKAADSIGANIAEGTGRGSFVDNRRFVRIARGSLNETQHWLRRAYKRHLLSDKEIVNDLTPALNGYWRSVSTAAASQRLKKDNTSKL
ncbi:MAG: four helix bundle protein [Acidobacteria bacterium]|nr:MAG: four helix bundle protein [Acidobacteriota bacterium]